MFDTEPKGNLLTTNDVATRLAVSTATVYRLAAAGRLRKIKVGGATRYHAGDVEALIDRPQHEVSSWN